MVDEIDPIKDEAEKHGNNAENAAGELGDADQNIKDADKDLHDDDQSAADKSKNMVDNGTDALDNVGDALDELGIGDPGFDDVADAIDDVAEDIFGRAPPDTLPSSHLRVYFGKKGTLDSLGDNLISDGLDVADDLAGDLLSDIPIVGEFSEGTVSSFFEDHEVEPEIDQQLAGKDGFTWFVRGFRLEEGLSKVFRCELVLSAEEDPMGEISEIYPEGGSSGSLLDSMAEPVTSAMNIVEDLTSGPSESVEDMAVGLAGDGVADLLGLSDDSEAANAKPRANVRIDPAVFLGATCSFCLTRELGDDPYPYVKRWVTGVVSEFTDLGHWRDANIPATRAIRIVIVPELWKLSLRKDCRVFQDMHALEIMREVFRGAGVYGFMPDVPGVGSALDAITDVVSSIPVVGGAAAGALSGQFVKTLLPEDTEEDDWTPRREICVQYNETDLDFVLRLLAEEGINFFFAGSRGSERLVLVGDPTAYFGNCQTVDGRGVPYNWKHDHVKIPPVEAINKIQQQTALVSNKVTLEDFNYAHSSQRRLRWDSEAVATELPETYEVQRYPARTAHRRFVYESDTEAYEESSHWRNHAEIHQQALASRATFGEATTNVMGLAPGTVVKLKGTHLSRALQGEKSHTLLVRSVRHGGGSLLWSSDFGEIEAEDVGEALSYENHFEFQWLDPDNPQKTPFRPPLPPEKPLIRSIQTATVVDEEGDDDVNNQINIDDLASGRIRVRFHWDRRGEIPVGIDLPFIDRGKSCWVRVAQQWAGNDWGFSFIPRVGMEVAVSFEDGDPDRPVVIGCVYNGEKIPPWTADSLDPEPAGGDKKKVSGFRTQTFVEDEDIMINELSFNDCYEQEEVQLHAGKYLLEEVRNDHFVHVGNDQENTVGRHHGEIVEGHQSLIVGNDREKTIEVDEDIEVHADLEEMIVGEETVIIAGSRNEKVEGRETIIVGKPGAKSSREVLVNGMRKTCVGDFGDYPHRRGADLLDGDEWKDDEDNKFHDHLIVTGKKRDRIKGKLEVTAQSFGAGAPAGEETEEDDSRLGCGDDEQGIGKLRVSSNKNVDIEGKGKVTLRSEHSEVAFEAKEGGLTVTCGGNAISLVNQGADGLEPGLDIGSDKEVKITCAGASATFSSEKVELTVDGSPAAALSVDAEKMDLSGDSMTISMRGDLDLKGAAIDVG